MFIVDDDAASLQTLTLTDGHPADAFASTEDFLAGYDNSAAGCLAPDMRLAGRDLEERTGSYEEAFR